MKWQHFLLYIKAALLSHLLCIVISCAPTPRTEIDATQRYGGGGTTIPQYGNQGYVPPAPRYQKPYYQQNPYYHTPQPQYRSPYQRGVVPGSRFYSNPYAIPPSNQYPQYDADQYYVPPTYYQNVEPEFDQLGQ